MLKTIWGGLRVSNFCVRFKQICYLQRTSQADLAELLNVSTREIRNYLTGVNEPDYDKLVLLAKYFDVSTDELLGLSEERSQSNAIQANTGDGLAQRLRALRQDRHLTQEELGRAIGLKKQTINDMESGRHQTTLNRAVRLADFFGVSLDYLVGRSDTSVLQQNE